ncbi:MAG TPA: DUF4412 domain-containing protein [Caldithrix abyssi]|uniref:DUF4412 domain-containing protein n=1 Tax=Caldithrix abyssi TaxID=187145 RepID=A0A7V4TYR6_CALAY|nr:DUF4412 domain-containing protein [Caldithrix abyssi]
MTNKYMHIIILLSLLFCVYAWAQQGIYLEQRVHRSGVMGQPAKDMIQKSWLTDNAVRVESADNTVIFRFDQDKVWTLQPAQKTYIELTMDQMRAMAHMGMSMMKESKQNKFDVKITGKKKTINGWKCYEVISKSPTMKQSIWLTKDLPYGKEIYYNFFKRMPKVKEMAELIYNNKEIEGFPVLNEMEMNVMGIEIKSSSELKKVREEKISPKLFELPKNYTKTSNPMMQMPRPR